MFTFESKKKIIPIHIQDSGKICLRITHKSAIAWFIIIMQIYVLIGIAICIIIYQINPNLCRGQKSRNLQNLL